MQTTYNLPADLVQSIANLLGELPARVSRSQLNALEAECTRQDEQRAAEERQRLVDEALRTAAPASAPETPAC